MGHHDSRHGRVFRGLKKSHQKVVPYSKRSDEYSENIHNFIHRQGHNTNGDKPIMRVPEGFPAQKSKDDSSDDSDKPVPKLAQKAQADDDSGVETVYEQVFKTLEQTFDGPPQFFSTQHIEPTSTRASQPAAQTTAASDNSRKQNDDDEDQTPSRKPVAQNTATSSSSAEPTASSSSATETVASSTHKDETSATSSAIEVSSSSIVTGDMTSTRGAALADNTSSMVRGTPLSASTESATAEPEQTGMTGGAKAGLAMGIIFGLALVFGLVFFCWRRKKSQRGLEEHNEKSVTPAPVNRFSSDSDRLRRTSTQTSATAPRLSLRPVTQFLPNLTTSTTNDQNTTQNPFGDAAVVSEKNAPSHDRTPSVKSDSNQSVVNAAPATPGSAQIATAAAVPVARGPNNVHRVQLEFKPSMEDELELQSGQLVRMLHEYDDGWVSAMFTILFHMNRLTNLIIRLSAPRWIAARRVWFLAHVSRRCP